MRRIRIKGVNDMKEYAFGIDLGGTTAKVGLFTTSGKLLEKWEVSTDTSNNGAHILENLAAAVQQKMQEKGLSADEVEGVGLGVPGPVLDSSIVPIVCANLGGWATATSPLSSASCWAASGCWWATTPTWLLWARSGWARHRAAAAPSWSRWAPAWAAVSS